MPVDVKESSISSKYELVSENSLSTWEVHPGSRRSVVASETTAGDKNFIRSGGNALMEYDDDSMKDLVRVTIPENVRSGQLLQVNTPDGRMAHFMVPFLAKTGSDYLIKFPSVETAVVANQSNSTKSHTGGTSPSNRKYPSIVNGKDIDNNGCHEEQTPIVVPSVEVDCPITPTENNNSSVDEKFPNVLDSMILVCVPPGVAPGTQMDVMCGKNNEKLNVTVPPGGVSQFYVARPKMNRCASYNCKNKNTGNFVGNNETPINGKRRGNEKSQKQNWHDHPAAYAAPMIAGSFFY